MTPDQIISILTNITIWDIFRIILLFLLGFYLIFAFVVIRQVGLMTKTLQVELEWLIKLIAWIHFFLAVLVLIITWTTL